MLEATVSGRGSRGVALNKRDGRRGLMTVEQRDVGGWETVDERDVGSCHIHKREMLGVAEGVKGDGSRSSLGDHRKRKETSSGRRGR